MMQNALDIRIKDLDMLKQLEVEYGVNMYTPPPVASACQDLLQKRLEVEFFMRITSLAPTGMRALTTERKAWSKIKKRDASWSFSANKKRQNLEEKTLQQSKRMLYFSSSECEKDV